jgi:hypothetical protein
MEIGVIRKVEEEVSRREDAMNKHSHILVEQSILSYPSSLEEKAMNMLNSQQETRIRWNNLQSNQITDLCELHCSWKSDKIIINKKNNNGIFWNLTIERRKSCGYEITHQSNEVNIYNTALRARAAGKKLQENKSVN